jgi:archaellum component FlaC
MNLALQNQIKRLKEDLEKERKKNKQRDAEIEYLKNKYQDLNTKMTLLLNDFEGTLAKSIEKVIRDEIVAVPSVDTQLTALLQQDERASS